VLGYFSMFQNDNIKHDCTDEGDCEDPSMTPPAAESDRNGEGKRVKLSQPATSIHVLP